MTKLVKEEGKMEKCPSCKQSMICKKIQSKDGEKLQWQNMDGKSHYLFNNGNFSCRDVQDKVESIQKEIQAQPIQLKDIDLDLEILTRIQRLTHKSTQVIKAIEYYVRDDLGETNPARIGMYVNNICDKLLNVSNLAEVIEDIGGKNETS